jgi:hypothetical protein
MSPPPSRSTLVSKDSRRRHPLQRLFPSREQMESSPNWREIIRRYGETIAGMKERGLLPNVSPEFLAMLKSMTPDPNSILGRFIAEQRALVEEAEKREVEPCQQKATAEAPRQVQVPFKHGRGFPSGQVESMIEHLQQQKKIHPKLPIWNCASSIAHEGVAFLTKRKVEIRNQKGDFVAVTAKQAKTITRILDERGLLRDLLS